MKTPQRKPRKWRRRACLALLAALVAPKLTFVALDALFPFPQRHLDRLASPTAAPRVLDRAGNVIQAFVAPDGSWSFPVPLSAISPHLVEATIAVEDGRFRRHGGVDALAVLRAAWSNLTSLRTVSGASTITMQTIRLLAPRPRTLGAKLVEAFRALQLEELRSKDQILAGYLNLAPYGGNYTGAEAASRAYFGKQARDLTLAEAALLAGLPQAPSRLRPDRFPERARARRDAVLHRMLSRGAISHDALRLARREPVAAQRALSPRAAPHWAQLVRQRFPGRAVLHTTLDPQAQHIAETALCEAASAPDGAGISNGAAVVIENETGAVRALVGSRDFLAADGGQVNGAAAARSPGSALKPFTYALAFERGLCTPDAILADVPASYSGYEPENYDHTCRGPVAAREALAASLNIPAVRLAREVGHQNLYAFLKQLGFATLARDADHYGLALTLGSVEVTLLDLANAYAALARLGVYRTPRFLESEPAPEARRVLSEGAAWLVLEALSDARRLGLGPRWEPVAGQPRLAWKTGTSHGHRDAWTVACTPRHTVGVWLGNFSGRPARELVGVQAAAPVAARILDCVEAGSPSPPFARPASVQPTPLCAVSGMPAGPHCPGTRSGLALRAAGSAPTCPVHLAVKVDAATGVRLCPRCVGGREAVERVVESWPPELAAWLRHHGRGGSLPPPHNAGCATIASADPPPRILSPAPGQTYVLLPDAPHQRLTLKAASRAGTLYWFVNRALVATSAPLEPAFWPLRPGTHTITCADDAGQGASLTIAVR